MRLPFAQSNRFVVNPTKFNLALCCFFLMSTMIYWVRLGDTSVMTTVVSKGPPSTQNFLPLTVDYR